MAFQSNGPVTLALPPFRGVTRKIILVAGTVFLVQIVAEVAYAPLAVGLMMNLILTPHLALFGRPWQWVTYALLSNGLLNTAFALLSVWFFGSALEDVRGGRWLIEYVGAASIGGALLASALSYARLPGIGPYDSVYGLWPLVLGLLLAFARMNPEAEMRLYFVLRLKAKYLLAIFLLFYLTSALLSRDRFSALTALCVAFCGYLFLRFVPRRGVQFAASEAWFGVRNAFYRAKRRRAAKQFTVYMRKQGRNVDAAGKYVEPNDSKDPNDKRWMN